LYILEILDYIKKMTNKKPLFSIVIPINNEKENILPLNERIHSTMRKMKTSYEVIMVDDGSTDGSTEILKKIKKNIIIIFRKNFGQSSALDAGIKVATGDYIITLDGDGQNDPVDIPKMYEYLINDDLDVVCGWRKVRKDTASKRIISNGARVLRRILVDDGIHDSGCTLRIYKQDCFEDLDLYGELHRMIPALLKWRGYKVGEIEVSHHERQFGVSKYGWQRTIKGFLDMIYIWFWRKYASKPLHIFGGLGLLLTSLGLMTATILLVLRLFFEYSLSDKIWPLFSMMLILVGLQLLLTGLLAASNIENGKKKYFIRNIKK